MVIEKIFSWIIDLMLMLFAILFLTFSLIAMKDYHFDTSFVKEYKENWAKGPIIDIASFDTTCPPNYNNFISTVFPGNEEGCDCTTSNYEGYKGKLFSSQCDSYQIAYNCKMIFAHSSLEINFWKGKRLCVLRLNSNFWQLETSSGDTCKRNMKKCGILDTSGNLLCVEQNMKCPINDIAILKTGLLPTFTPYTQVKIDNNYNLFYTNTQTDKPIIIDFEVSQYPICVHPKEGKLGENTYPLNKLYGPARCTTKIGRLFEDPRFTSLDSEPLVNLYTQNSINKQISRLPNYPATDNTALVTLYDINYFGWDKKCFNNPDFTASNIITPQEEVDKYTNKAYTLAVLCVVHFLFVFMSILVYKMMIVKLRVSSLVILLIDLVNLIFLISVFVISLHIYTGTGDILIPYRHFIDLKCGDSITNDVLTQAFSGIVRVKGSFLPILILSAIEMAILIGYYVWFMIAKKDVFRYENYLKYN